MACMPVLACLFPLPSSHLAITNTRDGLALQHWRTLRPDVERNLGEQAGRPRCAQCWRFIKSEPAESPLRVL